MIYVWIDRDRWIPVGPATQNRASEVQMRRVSRYRVVFPATTALHDLCACGYMNISIYTHTYTYTYRYRHTYIYVYVCIYI